MRDGAGERNRGWGDSGGYEVSFKLDELLNHGVAKGGRVILNHDVALALLCVRPPALKRG